MGVPIIPTLLGPYGICKAVGVSHRLQMERDKKKVLERVMEIKVITRVLVWARVSIALL
jgi:hypothetical protein